MKTASKQNAIRCFWWCVTLLLCTGILLLSSQSSDQTMQTSQSFADPLIRWITSIYGLDGDPAAQQTVAVVVQWFVRKLAHFTEYAALGGALCVLHMSYGKRKAVPCAWLCAAAFAALDECLQLFCFGRSGMWQDVLLDAVGALCGALLAWLIHSTWMYRHNRS